MATVSSYRRLALWGTPAAVLGVLLVGLWNYRATEAALITRYADRQLALARTVAVGVVAEYRGHLASLGHLGALPSVQYIDADFLPDRLAQFFAPPRLAGVDRVVRVDARRQVWVWQAESVAPLRPTPDTWSDDELWRWAADPANRGTPRVWLRAGDGDGRLWLMLPIYESAASGEYPQPSGKPAGFLALVLDPRTTVGPIAGRCSRRCRRPASSCSDLLLDSFAELDSAAVITGSVPVPGVRLTVTDSGVGMGAETLSQIFDPFFTTKPVGQGTGLGLPTAQGIVQQSRGELRVTSAPGTGTRVDVVLPPSSRPLEDADEADPGPVRAPQAAKVLLVEDEAVVVRRFTRRTLEGLGYAVREASSGEEALAWLQAVTVPPDVLLTDVVMPGMNGVDLVTAARRRWPTLPVLFVSGHSADLLTSQGLSEEGGRLLPKPFTAGQLSMALRETVEQHRRRG